VNLILVAGASACAGATIKFNVKAAAASHLFMSRSLYFGAGQQMKYPTTNDPTINDWSD
jgi:hypothetical protein